MMRIRATAKFDCDLKKCKKKHWDIKKVQLAVRAIAEQNETELIKLGNHQLKGDLANFNELHIEKDWLLIYRIDNQKLVLALIRMGTHEELF